MFHMDLSEVGQCWMQRGSHKLTNMWDQWHNGSDTDWCHETGQPHRVPPGTLDTSSPRSCDHLGLRSGGQFPPVPASFTHGLGIGRAVLKARGPRGRIALAVVMELDELRHRHRKGHTPRRNAS